MLPVKDNPLAMASESLHTLPPLLSPTPLVLRQYWFPPCSSHLPTMLLPRGLCIGCSRCLGHSSSRTTHPHLLQAFVHILPLSESSLSTYLEV